jgi:RHS repeat-associated protein
MGQLGAEYSTAANPQTGIVYLTDDHLGSTRLITSGTAPATVVQRLDYFPFGENINLPDSTGNSNAVFANRNLVPSYNAGTVGPLQFTGKERDAETGLDFLEARYYSSAQGRFTSPDPVFLSDHRLADPQAWNLYSYVRNSPLTLTDRHGLDFYLDCKQSKNNASTCQGGHVGTTSTDANGKSTFTPTVVTSASLQDPNSGVTGTVTPGGVQIKTASGTYTGSFINGTPAATIQGSGILAPFTFTITGQQSGNTLEGRFRFNGTPEQAAQYLQSHGAWSYPLDAFNPFHPNSNQYRFSDPSNPSGPSIHIALPLESYLDPGPGYGIGLHTRPSSSEGDFHVDTHGTFWGHVQDVLDLLKR